MKYDSIEKAKECLATLSKILDEMPNAEKKRDPVRKEVWAWHEVGGEYQYQSVMTSKPPEQRPLMAGEYVLLHGFLEEVE